MDFDQYAKLVTGYFENDNREVNYQNRILIPFFEELCEDLDVVDTSMLTKEWNRRGIGRETFAGVYTPDLLITSKWKLKKTEKDTVEYKALVEVKTPTAANRKHAESEIKEYLEKVNFVILTDCVTWEFFMKENGVIYYSFYSLEKKHSVLRLERDRRFRTKAKLKISKHEFPARVCERHPAEIKWNGAEWETIKQAIKDFKIKKKTELFCKLPANKEERLNDGQCTTVADMDKVQ